MLYGDPAKDGMFAFRLKVPKDYHIPPHTHPKPGMPSCLAAVANSWLSAISGLGLASMTPCFRVGSAIAPRRPSQPPFVQ